MLQYEYMAGNQISVHTWAHPPLTTRTNEEIVAELGWSKEAIRQIVRKLFPPPPPPLLRSYAAHKICTYADLITFFLHFDFDTSGMFEQIGVTPNTMRPPYGDIDDRVRAISLQMGLTPIIWTSVNGTSFDTFDWEIAGGVVNADTVSSLQHLV